VISNAYMFILNYTRKKLKLPGFKIDSKRSSVNVNALYSKMYMGITHSSNTRDIFFHVFDVAENVLDRDSHGHKSVDKKNDSRH
jgi:hypothetical protein